MLLNEFRIFDSNKMIILEYKPNNLYTMKQLLIISTMLIIGTAAFAQKTGDMFLAGSFGISNSTLTIKSINGQTVNKDIPQEKNFNFSVEYGAFLLDNFRIALAVGLEHYKSPNESNLYDVGNSYFVNPNLSYYVKL